MSRIGKQPIPVEPGVTVEVKDNLITVKGPKGELSRELHPDIGVEIGEKEIIVTPRRQSKKAPALWGLSRAILANMLEGVSSGFEKKLEFEGVGYRASLEGGVLLMQLGFSHPVRFAAPEGISFSVEKNSIKVSGIDKELVGNTAASIRSLRPPEPYKGKGIRYSGEVIRRKAGKKAVAGG